MKRVLFDARWIRSGMTGVGQYAYNLLREASLPREDCGIILNRGCPYLSEFAGFRIFLTDMDLTAHPWTDLYEQFIIPLLCYRHGFKAFVSMEGRVPVFHPGISTFPVIFDLSSFQVRGSHSWKYAFFLGAHNRMSRMFATKIITISEKVRSEIIEGLGMPREKTLVVYPSDSGLAGIPPIAVPEIGGRFFLMVGVTNPRKNLAAASAALAGLRTRHRDLRLAVTGNPVLIDNILKDSPRDGVVNLGFVGQGELRFLYEQAAGLVYPSLSEGFGIPLLDAAGFGCPVLCSDIPVFREVMGDSAFYFDPASPESAASAMESVLAGARVRTDSLAGKFSWEKSARALMKGISGG